MSDSWIVYTGDCLEILKTIPANSIDSCVTDPPAGIKFMGSEWDSDKGGRDQWIAWLQAIMDRIYICLKPGAFLICWAMPRTCHWTMTAIENAGFRIQDPLLHVFGTGNPLGGQNVSVAIDEMMGCERPLVRVPAHETRNPKAGNLERHPFQERAKEVGYHEIKDPTPISPEAIRYDCYSTRTKPAAEIWVRAQKPYEKSVAANLLKWGVGAMNIPACRVEGPGGWGGAVGYKNTHAAAKKGGMGPPIIVVGNGNGRGFTKTHDSSKTSGPFKGIQLKREVDGKWPPNLLVSHHPECRQRCEPNCPVTILNAQAGRPVASFFPTFNADFLYIPKPGTEEKTEGLDGDQTHETVKATGLCSWLIRLVTPPEVPYFACESCGQAMDDCLGCGAPVVKKWRPAIVLDAFLGSGSMGVAAVQNGFRFIGIEMRAEHAENSRKRIAHAVLHPAEREKKKNQNQTLLEWGEDE